MIGEVITTKRGELTLRAESFVITSKSIRPLPDKHKGLTDPEQRVRQRYVDLIVNPAARDMLRTRATAVRSVTRMRTVPGHIRCTEALLTHGSASMRPAAAPSTSIIGWPSSIAAAASTSDAGVRVAPTVEMRSTSRRDDWVEPAAPATTALCCTTTATMASELTTWPSRT